MSFVFYSIPLDRTAVQLSITLPNARIDDEPNLTAYALEAEAIASDVCEETGAVTFTYHVSANASLASVTDAVAEFGASSAVIHGLGQIAGRSGSNVD